MPAITRLLAAAILLASCSSPPAAPGGESTPPPPSPTARPMPAPQLPTPPPPPPPPGETPPGAGGSGPTPTPQPPPAAPTPAMAVETVQVPASGDPIAFKTRLTDGELYLLKASGTVDLGGQKVDAEYAFGSGPPADVLAGMDVGVDIGVLQIHPAVHTTATPPGPGRAKWFGAFREDHVYYLTVTGGGAPLSLRLTRPSGGSGAIAVSLIPLSPAPPGLGKELDSVLVPVTKTVVSSTISTENGRLYLLQASGFGKVGGGGTHQGDAEYMDWDEAGTRKNEGEAGADFGIGVDEITFARMNGAGYQPRMRWWGPWRRDHTYYLFFVGTGKPIQFLYFDSGYGDNSPTDKLTVKLFDVP